MPAPRARIADLLGVSDDTVRRWVDAGTLPVQPDASNRKVIDGAAIAERIKRDVAARVAQFTRAGHNVHLSALLVGGTPAGELYAQRQGEACRAVGIEYDLVKLPADATQRAVKQTIRTLNADPNVTGSTLPDP